jgi:hypothetical protein
MLSKGAGRFLVFPRSPRVLLPALALLCATAAPARALERPHPEAGSYSIDAFVVRGAESRLPQELLAPPTHAAVLPEAGARGPVEVEWTADEHFGFRGYRLTATIEDGPLSGVATQWNVAPGSGRREGPGGAYAYRVRLNLPPFAVAHVRTALEGVRADGSRVLLAVRDVRARPRSRPVETTWSRRSEQAVSAPPSAASARSSFALLQVSTAPPLLHAAASDRPNAARVQAGGSEAARVRGPPPAAA